MNEPRRQVQDLWLTTPEPQFRAPQEGTVRTVTPSTMTTTTIVSAQLSSAYVGFYVIPEDGNIRGNPRQIKSFVTATSTATVDAAWTSTASVTTLRLWNPPTPPFVADSGSTTSIVDATHQSITNEPDNYWQNDHVLAKTGNNAGGGYKVNAFTSSSGTLDLTGDALGTAAAPGDLFLPGTLLRPEGPVTATVERGTVSRRIVGYKEADQAAVLTSHGTVAFDLPQRPLTASAGNSTAATPPYEMGRLLRDFMTETLDTGSTYSSQGGSVPTGVTITVGSGTGFTVGGFALMSTGEASQCTTKSSNVLTLPQLTAAANLASSNVYASAWYQFKTSDFRTRTFDGYRGLLQRQVFHGCVPTLEMSIARDQVVKFGFKYNAADAIEYAIAAPNSLAGHRISLYDTTVPVDGKGARFLIDSVPVFVGDIKINFGIKPMARNSLSGMNQMDGYAFDLEPVKITVSGYLADNDDTASYMDLQDRLALGNVVSLFYQKGSAPKETFCWAAPAAQITKSTPAMNGGALEFAFECEAVVPQAARGNSVSTSLPAFSLGWL